MTVDRQLIEQELRGADCSEEGGPDIDPSQLQVDPSSTVYRIDEAIDGVDGNCDPSSLGPGGVEFTDEPDDVVYCLSPVQ